MVTLMSETSNQSICVGCRFAKWSKRTRGKGRCSWDSAFIPIAVYGLQKYSIGRDPLPGFIACPVREDADPGKGDV